jgi:hypothetical protein
MQVDDHFSLHDCHSLRERRYSRDTCSNSPLGQEWDNSSNSHAIHLSLKRAISFKRAIKAADGILNLALDLVGNRPSNTGLVSTDQLADHLSDRTFDFLQRSNGQIPIPKLSPYCICKPR